jgi:hypothetical protein
VAFMVDCLMLSCTFWERGHAPVGQGADCATGVENQRSSRTRNTIRILSVGFHSTHNNPDSWMV